MAVICGRVLNTNACLRILALALAIVDILLARFGGGSDGYGHHTLPMPQNEMWLVIIASGAYVIILSAIVGTYFRGQAIPLFMEYYFISVGFALFIAGGGSLASRYSRNDAAASLALVVLLLATGVTMLVDFCLMVFNCRR